MTDKEITELINWYLEPTIKAKDIYSERVNNYIGESIFKEYYKTKLIMCNATIDILEELKRRINNEKKTNR